MKSMQNPRARSAGRRRLPSQLQSSRDGSFPIPLLDDNNPVEGTRRRLLEPERQQLSKYQRSETRLTQNQYNLSHRRLMTKNDFTCIGRQIQKLACVAPMICSKDRERIDDISRRSPYDIGTSYKDCYDSDFFDCETVFPDTNASIVQIPLQNSLPNDRSKNSLNDFLPCPNYSQTNNYLRIVKKAHELNETQSTGSCSLEDDCVSYKYHYFAKRWNNHNKHNNNERTDHSIEGRTESSSTDDGLEEFTGKSAGATETTATESTNTLSRNRSNSLDDERIIRIPTIRLLNVSLLDKSDTEFNKNNHDRSSVFDAENADLDPLFIFEDDDFEADNSQDGLNSTINDDSIGDRNIMNDNITDDSMHRNVMRFVHCPSSSSLKDKLPERTRKVETINSPPEMKQDANNGIPTTIKFDPNCPELEVRSSIDENEIDNPDYLNFTYSPAGSFDYQQDFSPSTMEELANLHNPSVTKLSQKVACVKQNSARRISIDGQERFAPSAVAFVPSAVAVPSVTIHPDFHNSEPQKDIVMAIIADLKQLENAECFHGDQAVPSTEQILTPNHESSPKVLSSDCNTRDTTRSASLHARSNSLPNFYDPVTGVSSLRKASIIGDSSSGNDKNEAIRPKSRTRPNGPVSPRTSSFSKLDTDIFPGNDTSVSHIKAQIQLHDKQTEVESANIAVIYLDERRRRLKVRERIEGTRSQIQTLIDKFESSTSNESLLFSNNVYGTPNHERRMSESMYSAIPRVPPSCPAAFVRHPLYHEQQVVSTNDARFIGYKDTEESNIPNKGFFWRSYPHGK